MRLPRRSFVHMLGTAALAGNPCRSPASAQGLPSVRVAAPTSEGQTDLYRAIKLGLFTRVGLDVAIVPVNNGAAGTAAVLAGTYDLAITNVISTFAAHLRGVPIVMVTPSIISSDRDPFGELQVASDAAVRSGADLNGKTVASPALGDINSLAIRAWVDKHGGDSRTLRFVEIPNGALEAAIVARRIDAAVLLPPALDASLAAKTTRTLGDAYAAIAPRFMGSSYVARRDWLVQQTDVAQRFVRTLAESTRYVNAHRAETASLVVEYTKIPIDDVQRMHRSETGTVLDPALVQPVIDVAARYGAIPNAFPAREVLWSSNTR